MEKIVMKIIPTHHIKVIVGLGNPGAKYYYNRHSIGFRVLDALAHVYGVTWHAKKNAECATIESNGTHVLLVKPQTFMNNSGSAIAPFLTQNSKPENMVVVHDELEKPFGTVAIKWGGSDKGHNGLRSITALCGPNFGRLRCGIGRPERKEDVPQYVLDNFTEQEQQVDKMIKHAVTVLEQLIKQ